MAERIEITVYPNQAQEIEQVLDVFQVPYVKTDAKSCNNSVLFYIITLPEGLSGALIEAVGPKINTKGKFNNLTHYKTESVVSNYLSRYESFLKEEQEISKDTIRKNEQKNKNKNKNEDNNIDNDDEDDYCFPELWHSIAFRSIKSKLKVKANRPVIEELISKTDAFSSRRNDVYVMVLIASVVALVGLISNSVAVIIGAMLISPLMGPISSIALNSVLGRTREIKQSLIFGAKLVSSSILLAAAITLALSMVIPIEITAEIQSRTEDRPVTIIVSILLGIAGGLAFITAIPEIIVGVAIAVALIPPAAVTGIGVGIGSFDVAIGAFLILISSIIGLVIGFLIIFLLKRVAPRRHFEQKKSKKIVRMDIAILIGLALMLGCIEVIFR